MRNSKIIEQLLCSRNAVRPLEDPVEGRTGCSVCPQRAHRLERKTSHNSHKDVIPMLSLGHQGRLPKDRDRWEMKEKAGIFSKQRRMGTNF